MALEKIFLGTTTGDKTGTGAKAAGQIINNNFDYLEAKIDNASYLIAENGFSLTDQNLTMNSGWEWLIVGVNYTNPAAVVINIPFAETGKQRIDLIVMNQSNTFQRIAGTESISNPVAPPMPKDRLQATLIVVSDGAISEPLQPIVGSDYILKQESNDFLVSYYDAVIEQVDLNDHRAVLNFMGTNTDVKSIALSGEFMRNGKIFTFKNHNATPLTIWHNSGTGNVKMMFSNEENFILQPSEVIQFSLNYYDTSIPRLEYIGIITDISAKVDKVFGKSLIDDAEITKLSHLTDAEITKLSHLDDTPDILKPLSNAAINALALKLTAGGYTGTAEDLRLLIISSTTGFSGTSVKPTDTPTGTGVASWIALQAGTYTNFGGVIVNANSIAIISRTALGAFSISQTAFVLTEYKKITDNVKIEAWTAIAFASGDQVTHLGKDWVSNAVTLSTDVPGTSSKWVERLSAYGLKANLESLYETGKNLFNKNDTTNVDGFYWNIYGTKVSSATLTASHLCYTKGAVQCYHNGASHHSWSVFTESKVFVRGGTGNVIDTTGGYYVGFTMYTSSKSAIQLESGSAGTSYESYELFSTLNPKKGSVKYESLSSDFMLPISEKSITKDRLIDSKLLFISGTIAQSIGASNEDSSTSSYSSWGNRFNLATDTIVNSIVVNTTYVVEDFSLNIYKANVLIFSQRIKISEVINGVILFPNTTYLAGINYDVMLDFDALHINKFSNTAVTGISTALYRSGGNVAAYPKPATTIFQLKRYTNLVYETNLTLKSSDISDFSTSVANLINGNLNTFELPSTLYVYKSLRNDFNYENVVKYLDRKNNYLRITGTGIKSYSNKATITPSSNISISADLYDEDFSVLKTKSINLVVKDYASMSGIKNIVCIGDSLTEGGRWIDKTKQLLTTKSIFNGIIQSLQGDATNFSEGRSGWALANYFSMSKTATGYHSPFLHPTGKKYYGVVEKNAAELLLTGRGGMSSKLNAIGFNVNGYPTTPTTESVVYSIANSRYEIWNGSAWIDSALIDGDFVFNFSTYRSTWNIPATDVLFVMLGMNDFRDLAPTSVSSAYTSFKSLIDQVIASAKTDNPSMKIGIGIPNTYVGSNDNDGGFFNKQKTRAMWEYRKLQIANYDNRTGESIYLVDLGLSFNTQSGFDKTTETPFLNYSGSELTILDSNTPHPGINNNAYFPMGQNFAAWVSNF